MGEGPGAKEDQKVLTGGSGGTCGLLQHLVIASGETEAERWQELLSECCLEPRLVLQFS